MMETKRETPKLDATNEVEDRPPKDPAAEGGGSGNSTRRPTGKYLERGLISTNNQAVEYELRRDVKIRVGNKIEKLSMIEAIILRLSNAALNGDVLAQRELLAQYRFERNMAAKIKPPEYDLTVLSRDELDTLERLLKKASPIRD
jgi:Family of unknown function (DUF5681)